MFGDVLSMSDTVTLSLPIDTPLPAPVGKWRRGRSKRIIATYTLEELAWALCCTDLWRVGLDRLEAMTDGAGLDTAQKDALES